MTQIDRTAVEQALAQYRDPYTNADLVSSGCLRQLDIKEGRVHAELVLGYAAAGVVGGIAQMLQVAVEYVAGVESAAITVRWEVPAAPAQGSIPALSNVKNIIAVPPARAGWASPLPQ